MATSRSRGSEILARMREPVRGPVYTRTLWPNGVMLLVNTDGGTIRVKIEQPSGKAVAVPLATVAKVLGVSVGTLRVVLESRHGRSERDGADEEHSRRREALASLRARTPHGG